MERHGKRICRTLLLLTIFDVYPANAATLEAEIRTA
jgi:hypothetical protein